MLEVVESVVIPLTVFVSVLERMTGDAVFDLPGVTAGSLVAAGAG